MESLDLTTVSSVAAAILAPIAAAFRVLWNHTVQTNIKTEANLTSKLAECEEKHAKAQTDMLTMSGRVGQLEGRIDGYKQAREDMAELPRAVAEHLKAELILEAGHIGGRGFHGESQTGGEGNRAG